MPRKIFKYAGFNVEVIGIRRINNAAYRWRRAYEEKGILGLDDTRKGNSGRPLERELTIEEKNKRLETKIKYLEAENEFNREFKQDVSGKVLLTDITYLTYDDNKRAYLSAIKDGYTNEIPAYVVSENIKLDIVIKTIDELIKNSNYIISENEFIHSDQGGHYTSPTFQEIVKSVDLGQLCHNEVIVEIMPLWNHSLDILKMK